MGHRQDTRLGGIDSSNLGRVGFTRQGQTTASGLVDHHDVARLVFSGRAKNVNRFRKVSASGLSATIEEALSGGIDTEDPGERSAATRTTKQNVATCGRIEKSTEAGTGDHAAIQADAANARKGVTRGG